MSFLRELSGLGSRPYPLDIERKRRVMVALAEKGMNISALAQNLGLSQPLISNIISGRRRSKKTEQRIAEYLGKDAEELFPPRSNDDIREMREAEAAAKGKAA
jgi:transcriptional regulator with XRE-family HTH domain